MAAIPLLYKPPALPGLPKLTAEYNLEEFEWKTRLEFTKIIPKIESVRIRVDDHPLRRIQAQSNYNEPARQLNGNPAVPLENILDGDDPLSLLQRLALRRAESDDDDDAPDERNEESPSTSSSTTDLSNRIRRIDSHSLRLDPYFDDVDSRTHIIDLKKLNVEVSDHHALDEELLNEFRKLSLSNLTSKFDGYRSNVVRLWKDEQRVDTLRIVILCAKLLMDSENPAMYPVKFCSATDVFTTFGNLVYNRLKAKSNIPESPETIHLIRRPNKISPNNISEMARETCLNWFSKIASIRELVPRLYAEAALLECYCFLDKEKITSELKKLVKLTNAVGDLLVNLYLRCYLCQVGIQCNVFLYNFLKENFDAFMITLTTFLSRDYDDKTNLHRYLETLLPGLEWILKGVIDRDSSLQEMFLRSFRSMPNNSILLLALLNSFEEEFVLRNLNGLIDWLQSPELVEFPKYKHLTYLGKLYERLLKNSENIVPEIVLKAVWDEVQQLSDTNEYLNVLVMWLPLSVKALPVSNLVDAAERFIMEALFKYLNERVNLILQTLGPHVARETFTERCGTRLENVVRHLARNVDDFFLLLISENFLAFLNTLPQGPLKVTICKIIMETLVQRSGDTVVCDSVTLDSMMRVARTLHNSIRMGTIEDERKQIGNLLAKFIRLVGFGDECDRQLLFYVNARNDFYQLDIVLESLVHCINRLLSERLKLIKGHHSPRSMEFALSCIAYNFITIPSIDSPLTRMQLWIITGQVALANQCVDIGAACFIQAIDTIQSFNRSKIVRGNVKDMRTVDVPNKEFVLKSYISEIMSILIVIPDDPDSDILRMCVRLLRAVKEYKWSELEIQPSLMILFMRMFSVCYQEVYPYHFLNVDSNDILYGADDRFREKIDIMITHILRDLLKTMIRLLDEKKPPYYPCTIGLELLSTILMRGDLTNKSLALLALNIWCTCPVFHREEVMFMSNWMTFCQKSALPGSLHESIIRKIKSKLSLDRPYPHS